MSNGTNGLDGTCTLRSLENEDENKYPTQCVSTIICELAFDLVKMVSMHYDLCYMLQLSVIQHNPFERYKSQSQANTPRCLH